MTKQKTNKSIQKRVKVSAGGKLLRRNQLAVGHLRRNKSKSALNRYKKTATIFKTDAKQFKKRLGI